MKLKTVKLLITSIIIILISVLLAEFWEKLGLERKYTPALGVALLTAFIINISGITTGIKEREINHRKATRAVLLHLLLALLFIVAVTYSILSTR